MSGASRAAAAVAARTCSSRASTGDGNVSSLWREDPLHVDAVAVGPDGALWIAGRESDFSSNRLRKLGSDGQRQLSIVVNDESWSSFAQKVAPGPAGSLYVIYDNVEYASIFGRRVAGDGADIMARPSGGWLLPFYIGEATTLGDQPLPRGEHLLWIDEH